MKTLAFYSSISGPGRSPAIFRRGFSLVEILLAILIFAVTVVPLIQIFIQSTRDAESAGDFFFAQCTLVAELEKLKSQNAISPDAFASIYGKYTATEMTEGKYVYRFTVDPDFEIRGVSPFDGSLMVTKVYELTAEATWASRNGRKQTLSYQTTLVK